MKILMITQNFYPELGSAANRMKVIFKHLIKRKHDVTVITTEPTYPNQALFEDRSYFDDEMLNQYEGYKIIRLIMRGKKQNKIIINRLLYYFEQYIKLRIFLNRHKDDYDCVYVTSPNIFLAWATLFFKKKDLTYILEIRDLWPDSVDQIKGINITFLMPLLRYLETKMYNAADKIVVNNKSFIPHIRNQLRTNKPIKFIPNGLEKEEIKDMQKYNDFTVIYSGNIGYAQDLSKIIQLTKSLNDQHINVMMIIYGVKAEEFRKSVAQLKYVTIKPAMSRQDCLTEISKCHVSLSILEGNDIFLSVLPGKITDAIGVGTLPVTNIGGHANEMINNEQLGIAIENAQVDALLTEIEYLKNNRKQYEKLQKNTKHFRNDNLLWESNIVKLEKFLKGEM